MLNHVRNSLLLSLLLASALNCGSEGSSTSGEPTVENGAGGNGGAAASSGGKPGQVIPEDYIGRWSVRGTDSQGAYQGEVEIRRIAGGLSFQRAVRYAGPQVEDARDLHVAWTGTASRSGTQALALSVSLDPRGFVASRGPLQRKLTDSPTIVTGDVRTEQGAVVVRFTHAGASWEERWENPSALPAEALLNASRTTRPMHGAPPLAFRAFTETQFASYRALPDIAPYASRPDFQAAIHMIVDDHTDFDFYRTNRNAIRVWNKPVDGISVLESKLRADAFRWTLAEKAEKFEKELETIFVDATGMVTAGGLIGGEMLPSNDGALWTATFVAAEAYRYQVTGNASALANVRRSLDALLKLQEVTGDWSRFARTLRLAGGPPNNRWHRGAGALSGLEWKSEGNNDMLKGILYGQIIGYKLLCKSGNDPLCARIRTNAKHIADDLSTDIGASDLYGPWIASAVSNDLVERTKYRVKAETEWAKIKVGIRAAPSMYELGIADWSGLHLNFISNLIALLLAEEVDLGGDARSTYLEVVRKSYANVKGLRLPSWEFMSQAFGEPKNAVATQDATWILREFPFPKARANMNHKVSPNFCVSPYPRNAWNNDWLVNDRVRSLYLYPYYEVPADDFNWKQHMEFEVNTENWTLPGSDYVHIYWFARKHGLLTGAE